MESRDEEDLAYPHHRVVHIPLHRYTYSLPVLLQDLLITQLPNYRITQLPGYPIPQLPIYLITLYRRCIFHILIQPLVHLPEYVHYGFAGTIAVALIR